MNQLRIEVCLSSCHSCMLSCRQYSSNLTCLVLELLTQSQGRELKLGERHKCSLSPASIYHRESHGSGSAYHKELSKQLAQFLEKPLQVGSQISCFRTHTLLHTIVHPLQEVAGIMTLADVYCRFNRARGMEVRFISVACVGTYDMTGI